MLFDESHNWKPHIETITKKIRQFNSVLYLIRKFTNNNTARIAFFSLIYPHIIYGIQSWGINYKSNLNQINIALKSSIRIINKKGFNYPTKELFMDSKILDFNKTLIYNIVVCFFKNKNNYDRVPLNINTRSNSSGNYFIVSNNTNFGRFRLEYFGPVLFNKLPNHIKHLTKLNVFKKHLKKWCQDVNNSTDFFEHL